MSIFKDIIHRELVEKLSREKVVMLSADEIPSVSLFDLEESSDGSIVLASSDTKPAASGTQRKSTNIKDILNDILEYILGHFSLTRYVIGVVVDSSTDASLAFSVKKLGIKASLDVKISSEYTVTGEDIEKSPQPYDCDWIQKDFADIVTAVKHNSKRFERIETISKHSSIGASIDFSVFDFGGSYQRDQKLKIYIFFEQ